MVSVVAFFVNGRFRLPVAPVLIVFASYAVFHAVLAARARSADVLRIAAILALCVLVVDYDYVAFRGVRSLDESVSFYELANASLKMDDKEAALSYFEQAHSMQQRYPMRGYAQIAGSVDFNLGMLYWEKGLYTRAIDALRRVPEGDPRTLQARALLADAYTKKGQPQEAIVIYTRLLQTNPDDPRILYGLGFACRAAGDLGRAREALEAGLRIQRPPDGSVHLELARTLERLGDTEGALRNYEIASASPAQKRDATIEMARLYAKGGMREKALAYMDELRRAHPDDPSIEAEANSLRSGRPTDGDSR
jgi:tetratricopeptide (TPR) repeat protein